MSAAATAPSQLVIRRRRYRLPGLVSSFRCFKLRQGAKWTIRQTTPFFSSCDIRFVAIATAPGWIKSTPKRINQHTRRQPASLGAPNSRLSIGQYVAI
jgi:hypothetical protein